MLAWGGGVWALLSFGMQIALVIFAGYVLAVAPPVARALEALARVPRGPRSAVAWTAFLSMVLCWLNWGVGLIASAMLVRTIARARPDTDYRLLVAVAYLGHGHDLARRPLRLGAAAVRDTRQLHDPGRPAGRAPCRWRRRSSRPRTCC